jgi:hypothetical protein
MSYSPVHLVATDWTWSRPNPSHSWPNELNPDWWVAVDNVGRKWVVKMRGSTYAYREHVFSALAQRLGISCQSSVYLTIPRNAPPMLRDPKPKSHQLALCFLNEHRDACSEEKCPLRVLDCQCPELNTEADLQSFISCGISRAVDRFRGEILGYLCGQDEPPGWLFTLDHSFVQIDNEMMFATGPADLKGCEWLRFSVGRQCAENVCTRLSELSNEELLGFAQIPKGYVVEYKSDIRRRLLAARKAANSFLVQNKITAI